MRNKKGAWEKKEKSSEKKESSMGKKGAVGKLREVWGKHGEKEKSRKKKEM